MANVPRVNKGARKERFQTLGWWSWFLKRRTLLYATMEPAEADRAAGAEVERLIGEGKLSSDVDPVSLVEGPYGNISIPPPETPEGRGRVVSVAGDRLCRDPAALIWYLYETMDDLEATPAGAPSRGAWYQLQAMREDSNLKADFYRNIWAKILPKGGLKEERDGKLPADSAIVTVRDVYDALDAACDSEGEEESEVADGGVEESGGESGVSEGVD